MKKIIDMYFNIKNYLKNTRNHTAKHVLIKIKLRAVRKG